MKKKRYLAVYDYGTGGAWAVVSARSSEEILAKYPVLRIFDKRPDWMSREDYADIAATDSYDIDDPPSYWLRALPKE